MCNPQKLIIYLMYGILPWELLDFVPKSYGSSMQTNFEEMKRMFCSVDFLTKQAEVNNIT